MNSSKYLLAGLLLVLLHAPANVFGCVSFVSYQKNDASWIDQSAVIDNDKRVCWANDVQPNNGGSSYIFSCIDGYSATFDAYYGTMAYQSPWFQGNFQAVYQFQFDGQGRYTMFGWFVACTYGCNPNICQSTDNN